ncbi:ABC transporter ATP-binding protein [Thermaerobacter subterraneus]|uniref:ABC-type multidrug transport system, ATPase component n=1 Tax=Thermaerobacter subterraneus DSM 13965 TaxID=867903 RepID=K6PQN6_9FIRM|nr:ABC transporter ATP-binding protein [Thermaerobacter subterraneus]EKP95257.1 ABC-type multidrug transport system, ATPase component [Thermaerobacter subterraneus DSM 13965]
MSTQEAPRRHGPQDAKAEPAGPALGGHAAAGGGESDRSGPRGHEAGGGEPGGRDGRGEPAIVTRRLRRLYGRVEALVGIDMVVPQGAIYGFIGPNGAGKTTCLRILAGLLDPSGGEARVCGVDVTRRRSELAGVIGYMPDFFGVYDDLTVTEYLDFYAACYGLRGPAARRRRDALLELVDLAGKAGEPVNGLSRGMKQRLGLARALIHDPQVLLLDEPASGLDPAARIEFRELMKELAAMGKTLVVSSHILSELADFCTHIGILHRGRLLVSGTMDQVLAAVRRRSARFHLLVPPQDDPEAVAARARQVLASLPAVTRVEMEPAAAGASRVEGVLDFAGGPATLATANARLVEAGLMVSHLAELGGSLEEAFLHAVETLAGGSAGPTGPGGQDEAGRPGGGRGEAGGGEAGGGEGAGRRAEPLGPVASGARSWRPWRRRGRGGGGSAR